MDAILEAIGVENLIALVAALVGFVWTTVKGLDVFQEHRRRRYWKAVEFLEAGIQHTYETYVREIKLAREDGKLANEERELARERAIAFGKEYAAAVGMDLVKTLGKEYLPVLIEKIISRFKVRAKKAQRGGALTPASA